MSDFFDRLLSGEREAIFLAAAAYFVLMGVIATAQMIRLSRWPSVLGELHSEDVERHGRSGFAADERDYKAAVRYSYRVDGITYDGHRLNPWSAEASHNLRFLLKLQFRGIERHEGGKVTVFHKPGQPEKSYLHVPGWKAITLVAGLCFMAASLLLTMR